MIDPQGIQNLPHQKCYQIVDILGAEIKRRHGRYHPDSKPGELKHIFQMNGVQWRLPRDKHKCPSFFQHDISSTSHQIVRSSVRNRRQGSHRAGHNDHSLHQKGTAGNACSNITDLMIEIAACISAKMFFQCSIAIKNIPAKLLLDYPPSSIGNDDMNIITGIKQCLYQLYPIDRTARSRNTNNHSFIFAGIHSYYRTTKSIKVNTNTTILRTPFIMKKAVCNRLRSLGDTI
ncbi:hypothetical protein D3C73_993000 [compost metagenome]